MSISYVLELFFPSLEYSSSFIFKIPRAHHFLEAGVEEEVEVVAAAMEGGVAIADPLGVGEEVAEALLAHLGDQNHLVDTNLRVVAQ